MMDQTFTLQRTMGTLTKCLLIVLFLGCISLIGVHSYRRPAYNWDMLAYMALVIKMDHRDTQEIHQITYDRAKEELPPASYRLLITGSYRKQMAADPSSFYRQLPFYAVKPLYIYMIYFFHQGGVSLTRSTVLPSILFYILTGLLLFYWMSRYYDFIFAFIAGVLMMYSTYLAGIANLSTPDSLSCFLLLSAFYFMVERPSVRMMFLFLLLSVFARLDNVVTAFIILSFLFFTGKWEKKIRGSMYIGMMLTLVICYFFITWMTVVPFGWNILYYPTLLHYFNLSYAYRPSFSMNVYLALLVAHGIAAAIYSPVGIFVFMAMLIAYPGSKQSSKITFEGWFALLLVWIICFRFMVYPNLEDRFYISFYLCILMLMARKLAGRRVQMHPTHEV